MNKKRICQSCKKEKLRSELFKITKLKDGSLKLNPSSNELGRSAYVCKNIDCVNMFIKKKRMKNALKFSNFENMEKIEKELLSFFEK